MHDDGHDATPLRNDRDGIFRQGGSQLMLNAVERDGALMAAFDIGLSVG